MAANTIRLPADIIEKIISAPKGSRPDPKDYLSKEYIDNHIEKFQDKGTIIMSLKNFIMFVENRDFIGYDDNTQYITKKDTVDDIFSITNDKENLIVLLCDRLSLSCKNGNYPDSLVRIDVKNIHELNPRLPSGNENGANEYFTPGGFTSNGLPELVINKFPKGPRYVEKILIIK